jgi:hypothetical protein
MQAINKKSDEAPKATKTSTVPPCVSPRAADNNDNCVPCEVHVRSAFDVEVGGVWLMWQTVSSHWLRPHTMIMMVLS